MIDYFITGAEHELDQGAHRFHDLLHGLRLYQVAPPPRAMTGRCAFGPSIVSTVEGTLRLALYSAEGPSRGEPKDPVGASL